MRPFDILFFGLVILGSCALAALGGCPLDWPLALATVALCIFWAAMIRRRVLRNRRSQNE